MNTKRTLELLEIFKAGVSHDPKNGLQNVIDYQDCIGRASMAEIREFEDGLAKGQDKRHFVWVNFLTLSQDMAVDILKNTVLHRERMQISTDAATYIAKELAKLNDREEAVQAKEVRLNDAKRSIWKRIADLREALVGTKRRAQFWEEQAEILRVELRDANIKSRETLEKAEKYDELKKLLA